MCPSGPVTLKDRWTEGDLEARFPGWTVRIQVLALIAAEDILEAEIATILGALHRSVTRTGLGVPPRTDHVTGMFLFLLQSCISKYTALLLTEKKNPQLKTWNRFCSLLSNRN